MPRACRHTKIYWKLNHSPYNAVLISNKLCLIFSERWLLKRSHRKLARFVTAWCNRHTQWRRESKLLQPLWKVREADVLRWFLAICPLHSVWQLYHVHRQQSASGWWWDIMPESKTRAWPCALCTVDILPMRGYTKYKITEWRLMHLKLKDISQHQQCIEPLNKHCETSLNLNLSWRLEQKLFCYTSR